MGNNHWVAGELVWAFWWLTFLFKINFYLIKAGASKPPYQMYIPVCQGTSKQWKICGLPCSYSALCIFECVQAVKCPDSHYCLFTSVLCLSFLLLQLLAVTFSFLITCILSFSLHILPPLPCCSVVLCRTFLPFFTSPDLLFPTTNTLLFSRVSQGHCEITYFTDNLSCVTLFTHQTADPLTLSLSLPKP